MKSMSPVVIQSGVIELIDHRAGESSQESPTATIQNDPVGAAATIVVERFISARLLPETGYAKLLYGGLIHNSLNFLSSNTTQRDYNARKYLEAKFSLKPSISAEMFIYAAQNIITNLSQATC